MRRDLQDLRITQNELENVTGLEVNEVWMGGAVRPFTRQHPGRLLSFLVTELLVLGLILIFCLPIGLIIARNFGDLTSDLSSTVRFLQLTVGISVAIAAVWNAYIWRKGQRLTTLASLLDEVDKHNDIIKAVVIIDELGEVKNSTVNLLDREEILEALGVTRESLVCALMTEKILRKHKNFISRRHELFTNIESNLTTLQTLKVNSQATEYGQLLNEALQIGISVHRELRKFES